MKDKKGKVIILGAGPGDPGYISVRGMKAVESAEVLVYDYLANPALLDKAPPLAERIYVGKKGASHTMEQEDINRLLADKAAEGSLVVRLKGGDPYIFGRGSEEAEYLRERDIEFEVVPGIPAAIGAAATAGIPLTDRRHTSTLAFVTGHEDPTKDESSIDWEALSKAAGTIVFYMGVKNLPDISAKLIAAGRPAGTPVALVEWATMPRQHVVRGTLENIASIAAQNKIHPPALIIVGTVNDLSPSLDWFERRPLFGKTIVVTRSRKQASRLVDELGSLGAATIEMPAIEVIPPESWAAIDAAISEIEYYDWVIFTSVNGVDFFMSRLIEKGSDARKLARARIAAIGPATSERLREYGLRADFQPGKFIAESIVEGLKETGSISGKKFLLPRADIAREALPEKLAEEGGVVNEVPAYRTVPGDFDSVALKKEIESGGVAAVTFTSSSTVTNFIDRLGKDFILDNKDKFKAVSIGPVTSGALRKYGVEPAAEADEFTIPGLVAKVLDLLGKKN